jgi:hypothetical protein
MWIRSIWIKPIAAHDESGETDTRGPDHRTDRLFLRMPGGALADAPIGPGASQETALPCALNMAPAALLQCFCNLL